MTLNDHRFDDTKIIKVPTVSQTGQHQTYIVITINHGAGEDMQQVAAYIDRVSMYDVALKYGPTFEDWETFVADPVLTPLLEMV